MTPNNASSLAAEIDRTDAKESWSMYRDAPLLYDHIYQEVISHQQTHELVTGHIDGGEIVELGAGTGLFTQYVHDTYDNVTAVDLHPEMLSVLEGRLPTVATVQGNAIDYKHDSLVDSFLMFGNVADHFSPAMMAEFSENIVSQLSDGGVLMFSYRNGDGYRGGSFTERDFDTDSHDITQRYIISKESSDKAMLTSQYEFTDKETGETTNTGESIPVYLYDNETLRNLFSTAGFSDVTIENPDSNAPILIAQK